MGNIGSEFDCKGCACSCEDAALAARYGDVYGGAKAPEQFPFQEEVCNFQEASPYPGSMQDRKDMMLSSPGMGLPAERTSGSRLREESPDMTPRQPPGAGQPRQSWQDLDASGNYHLHFNIRQGERFGLQLVESHGTNPSGCLVVASVEPTGPFASTSRGSPGLFAGDIILKANNRKGAATTLRDIFNQVGASGGELDLVVQSRPAAFDACLQRVGPSAKKLGLSICIDRADNLPRMRVRVLRDEGLVPRWNEMNGTKRICVGDYITQVNGVATSADKMFKLLQGGKEGDDLEVHIETPDRDQPRQDMDEAAMSPQPTPRPST